VRSSSRSDAPTCARSSIAATSSFARARRLRSRGSKERLGVAASVTLLSANEVAGIVAENPLAAKASDPSRFLIAVLFDAAGRARVLPLAKRSWTPSALAIGRRAVYMWCPEGILDNPLAAAVSKVVENRLTARNWATLQKLHALVVATDSSSG
jgi:uncharacterized protein (DUF1697 family)